jgi:hypothetical protein
MARVHAAWLALVAAVAIGGVAAVVLYSLMLTATDASPPSLNDALMHVGVRADDGSSGSTARGGGTSLDHASSSADATVGPSVTASDGRDAGIVAGYVNFRP